MDTVFARSRKTYYSACSKSKRFLSLKTIEDSGRQFLIEKIIHGVEFSNPFANSIEKNPEIVDTAEKNYKISRRVYQSLFVDVADIFIEYIHSLDADEVQQLDDDLKANEYGAKSLLEIENAYEMLTNFQMFYYFNGRLPLTIDLLIVPDGETPGSTEKINLKLLYEMFKDKFSWVSFHLVFFCTWNIFWASSFYTKT